MAASLTTRPVRPGDFVRINRPVHRHGVVKHVYPEWGIAIVDSFGVSNYCEIALDALVLDEEVAS